MPAPAVRADRPPSRLDPRLAAESGDQLVVGHALGRCRSHGPGAMLTAIGRDQVALQVFADRARTQDREVVGDRQAVGDQPDEPREVLIALRVARWMRRAAAAPLPDGRVVADVTGAAVMIGNVRLDPLDDDLVAAVADDDRLVCVDPDERVRDRHARLLMVRTTSLGRAERGGIGHRSGLAQAERPDRAERPVQGARPGAMAPSM